MLLRTDLMILEPEGIRSLFILMKTTVSKVSSWSSLILRLRNLALAQTVSHKNKRKKAKAIIAFIWDSISSPNRSAMDLSYRKTKSLEKHSLGPPYTTSLDLVKSTLRKGIGVGLVLNNKSSQVKTKVLLHRHLKLLNSLLITY